LQEVREAYSQASQEGQDKEQEYSPRSREKLTEEIGDLMFVITNLARHMKIDPEHAARGANNKFCSRFSYIEQELKGAGRSLDEASLEEMDALWDEAKTKE